MTFGFRLLSLESGIWGSPVAQTPTRPGWSPANTHTNSMDTSDPGFDRVQLRQMAQSGAYNTTSPHHPNAYPCPKRVPKTSLHLQMKRGRPLALLGSIFCLQNSPSIAWTKARDKSKETRRPGWARGAGERIPSMMLQRRLYTRPIKGWAWGWWNIRRSWAAIFFMRPFRVWFLGSRVYPETNPWPKTRSS